MLLLRLLLRVSRIFARCDSVVIYAVCGNILRILSELGVPPSSAINGEGFGHEFSSTRYELFKLLA